MVSPDNLAETAAPNSPDGVILGDKRYRYLPHYLLPEQINVLAQPRKTFEDIPPLADDIAAKSSLIHPIIVACFDDQSCRDYVGMVNDLWKTEFKSEELVQSEGDCKFYVLLAGERRKRACAYLMEQGCSECQEKFGPGSCYERHFGDRLIEARLAVNIPASDALFVQASENIHMSVPPHQEARFYYEFMNALKRRGDNVTTAGFARKVGRTPEKIRNAVRFCELPDQVQDLVERKVLPYGIAVELARYKGAPKVEISDDELINRAFVAGTNKEKVPEYRKKVTEWINQAAAGQQDLFQIMDDISEQLQRKQARKHVFERRFLEAIHSAKGYFKEMDYALAEGLLGTDESPFAMGSPRRLFLEFIEIIDSLTSHMETHLTPDQLSRAKLVVAGALPIFIEATRETYSPPAVYDNGHSNNGHQPEADLTLQASLIA